MKTFPPLLLFMLQLALTRTSNVSRSTGPEPVLDALLPTRAHAAGPPGRSAVSVKTSCELNMMRVQVHRSVLGTGQPDSRLTLGTCGASRATRDYVLFYYDFSMCGTRRAMVNNQVAYLNELHFDPLRLQGPIRRAVPFRLSVACYYNRYQYSDYTPKLRQSAARMKTRTKLVLTPRNAQWDSLPPSGQYSLGRSMYFQAEAPPLLREERLYVHECYATPENSHSSTPQVPVVENSGCMVDSKDGRSRFIQYKRNVVRFSVNSFHFIGVTNQQLFMHCSMSVGSSVPTATAKACNYNPQTSRWEELYGPDSVCSCCDSSCSAAASTVTKIISSQPWTIDPKVKPRKSSRRKPATTTTTTTTTAATAAAAQETSRAAAVTPPGGAEQEWLFGGGGVSWVEVEERQVKGSAVVEEEVEEVEEVEVTAPHTIFDEIFGF